MDIVPEIACYEYLAVAKKNYFITFSYRLELPLIGIYFHTDSQLLSDSYVGFEWINLEIVILLTT